MSGGHFNYSQYYLRHIVDDINEVLAREEYPDDVREALQKAASLLDEAFIYVHRIDWLLSGDDGIESFRKRLAHDLSVHKSLE